MWWEQDKFGCGIVKVLTGVNSHIFFAIDNGADTIIGIGTVRSGIPFGKIIIQYF
jgi:hypothetical protein